jgi:hypothetical protein
MYRFSQVGSADARGMGPLLGTSTRKLNAFVSPLLSRLLHRQIVSLIALVVWMACSTHAFTPDAAFKYNNLLSATQPPRTTTTAQNPQQSAFAKQRNVQLSLIGERENIRKSITVPPAYEDYMAVRELSIRRLLGRE